MIQSLQWLCESLPLYCKCATGVLVLLENGHPLFCFFWRYPNASWWCCFNAWLSFWPGIAFGGVPLGFDSGLTGRTFPFLLPSMAKCSGGMIQSLQRTVWKSSTLLQVCYWDFSFYENGHPLFCFFWRYQNRKLAMLFQCLAKLLTWNGFCRCAIGIWLRIDRSHLPIFWFLA